MQRKVCVCVCVGAHIGVGGGGGAGGGKQSATVFSLSLSPQMMDSNSGENKTMHSSCCHHNETGT